MKWIYETLWLQPNYLLLKNCSCCCWNFQSTVLLLIFCNLGLEFKPHRRESHVWLIPHLFLASTAVIACSRQSIKCWMINEWIKNKMLRPNSIKAITSCWREIFLYIFVWIPYLHVTFSWQSPHDRVTWTKVNLKVKLIKWINLKITTDTLHHLGQSEAIYLASDPVLNPPFIWHLTSLTHSPHRKLKLLLHKSVARISAVNIYIALSTCAWGTGKVKRHQTFAEGIRWRGSRWMWSTSLSTDTSGIHLQTQKCFQSTRWEWAGVPDHHKEYISHVKLGRRKELGDGGNRSVCKAGPALSWWGNWSRGLIPASGRLCESEEKHLRLTVKQLICDSLNGRRIRQSLSQPYVPQMGMCVPQKAQPRGAGAQGS